VSDEARLTIQRDGDIIAARQKGRDLAAQAGFKGSDLTIIATAISEIARNIIVFAQQGEIEIVSTYSARAITSGGTLAASSFRRIGEEFLAAVRAAPPVDGIYLSLHGAMSAEGEEDPEGWLLAETRKILGERIPIVVSLDLHGILTVKRRYTG